MPKKLFGASDRPKRVPSLRHHKARNLAVVRINGHDHYLGKWGDPKSVAAYHRLIAELALTGSVRQAVKADPQGVSVAELIVGYMQHAARYYGKDSGEYRNMKDACRWMRAYDDTPAKEFGPLALKAVRQKMLDRRPKAKGTGRAVRTLSRKVINKTVQRIQRVFCWGVENELLDGSVYHALKTVQSLRADRSTARETTPVLPVELDVVERTLPHLSPTIAAMVKLQLLLGCRPGEICRIRPADIDRSGEVWKWTLSEHKTAHHGKSRTILIGPKAQVVIAPYLLRDAESFCFSPKEVVAKLHEKRSEERVTPLSCGNKPGKRKRKPKRVIGDCYTTMSYGYAIRRSIDRANKELADGEKIPRWAPNQLRHAKGTEVRQKYGLEAAQVLLGHSRADVTQVYAERDLTLAERVAKEVG